MCPPLQHDISTLEKARLVYVGETTSRRWTRRRPPELIEPPNARATAKFLPTIASPGGRIVSVIVRLSRTVSPMMKFSRRNDAEFFEMTLQSH
jgi:hypothetical protein